LIVGLSFLLVSGPSEGLMYGVIFGPSVGLICSRRSRVGLLVEFAFEKRRHKRVDRWVHRCVCCIDRRRAGIQAGHRNVGGIPVGLAVGLISCLGVRSLKRGVISGLWLGLIFGLVSGMAGGFVDRIKADKVSLNQGVKLSWQNSLVALIVTWLILGLIFGLSIGLHLGCAMGSPG
jgi:hypothetical protein